MRVVWSFLLLICLPLLAGSAARSPDTPSSTCEPSASIDLRARRISTVENEPHVTVGIELEVSSLHRLRSFTIQGSVSDSSGSHRTFEVPGTQGPLASRATRSVGQYLDLQPGVEHHVLFRLLAEDGAGEPRETTTYLRVNLDPDREPVRRGDLLQYPAEVEGW